MAQQIYAKIKKNSKYYHQNDWAKADLTMGLPFLVTIKYDIGGYSVTGGPGGKYRLSDVNLFVIDNDKEIRIS